MQAVETSDAYQRELKSREFVQLLAEHERRLSAYVHAIIPLWQDAEDVLQGTKLRLWEQFDTFERGTNFAAWMLTVAGFMVRAHRKKCQRQRVCFSDDLLEKISQYHLPRSSSLHEERLLALVECVKTLGDASRSLLHVFCTGHQRIKDIARDLGQTPTATRMALLRIRRSLFDCVQKRMREEEGR